MRIENEVQFRDWLEENYWLQDAFIDDLVPVPSVEDGQPPAEVRLSLRMQIAGGYAAGDVRRVRYLRVKANGVSEYTIAEATGFGPGHCCEGAEQIEVPGKIGIAFDAPAEVRLICEAIDIEQYETDEVIEPQYSDRDFSADASEGTLPTPAEWLRWYENHGMDVVWRYYASEEVHSDKVPQQNYSGWFLQLRVRLNEDPQGLFFFCGRQKAAGFELKISNYTQHSNENRGETNLWKLAADYVAPLPAVTLRCGNVTLTAQEWRALRDDIHRSIDGPSEE